ncbi:MAG: rhodanese-like domain-containing protein [Salibacteraceae bacterium]
MKKLFFGLGVVLISLSVSACGNEGATSQSSQSEALVKDISIDEFNSLKTEAPGIILDVRTPGEVAEGYVEGAVIIDITQKDFMDKVSKLDKSKPIYVYCKAGGRSANASQKLINLGFGNVYNVLGGMDAWKAKGLSLTK